MHRIYSMWTERRIQLRLLLPGSRNYTIHIIIIYILHIVCQLTRENTHSTMNCIRITTCQRCHQNIKKFRPSFRPVPVRNGRYCIGNTNTHTTNWLPKSNRQQPSNINLCLHTHDSTADGCSFKNNSTLSTILVNLWKA